MSRKRVLAVACSTEALVLVLFLGCVYTWETVETVANDDYTVTVRVQSTDATTPPVLKIAAEKSGSLLAGSRELVRLVGWHGLAKGELYRENTLLMSTFHAEPDYYKLYYVVNLDSPPNRELEIWSSEKWQDGKVLWSDATQGHEFALSQLDRPSRDFHLSCRGYPLGFDLFVLGAGDVSIRLTEEGSLSFDIEWNNGENVSGLLLSLPQEDTGFIRAVYPELE